MSSRSIFSNLLVYGLTHAVVDGICAAVIFSVIGKQIDSAVDFVSLVVLYDVLAFGLQAVFGFLSDYLRHPRLTAVSGCLLTGISALIFSPLPVLAIILAGVGNSLFHIGAGSISLNLKPRKAFAPGIYIAPGALGILGGTMLGKSGLFIAWPFITVLVILGLLIFIIRKPKMDYEKVSKPENDVNYFGLILLLIIVSIIIRSFVGVLVVFPWKTDISLLICLTLAIVLGKALGGVIADRFGWVKISVGALILSTPFIAFGADIPWLGIVGMFLFNITTAVTLVAISNLFPGRPGFAFGLSCLALILGSLPVFVSLGHNLGGNLLIVSVIALSAVSLFFALRLQLNGGYQKR